MKLSELTKNIGSLQNIQIKDLATGKILTPIFYLYDKRFNGQLDLHKDKDVYSITLDQCDNGRFYLIITIAEAE